jgi:hypothetical protein
VIDHTLKAAPKRMRASAPRVLGSSLAAVGLGAAGLHIQPASFPGVPSPATPPETMPLPTGLPTPVERFYRHIYGARVPVIRSAVVSGRGRMRPMGGITFPARFRFTHVAGQSYRHYFETTFWGRPVLRANEYYVHGAGRMELPWGVEEGEQIDQGANLSLWGESFWLPAILLTDARVRWSPIDDTAALLVVPFGAQQEHIVVRFDPATGLPSLLESMRYKGSTAARKTLWFNHLQAWTTVGGHILPTEGAVTWADDGRPWLQLRIEDVVYNVDVDTAHTAKGP